jgi:tRNA pseudouridine13 synthase
MSSGKFRPAGSAERFLGMEYFYTSDDGINGRLRVSPEDFVVEEISDLPEESQDGKNTAALVRSRNWETNRLIRQLSRNLHMSRKKVMFAGTKDKRAVTTQLFVFAAPLESVRALTIPGVDILRSYPTNSQIRIGDLFGNKFSIIVRELDVENNKAMETCQSVKKQLEELGGFPNYFGIQRFGAVRPITHIVGKHMVKGEFDLAVKEMLCTTGEHESEDASIARKSLTDTGDYSRALVEFPDDLMYEKAILNHLAKSPEDFVGALKQLPKNLLMMFVHAYQSYIFNKILSRRMERGLPLNEPVPGDLVLKLDKFGLPDHNEWLLAAEKNIPRLAELSRQGKAFVSAPLYGFESELAEGEPGEIEKKIIEETGAKPGDFVLPDFDRLGSKGTRREVLAPLRNFSLAEIEPGTIKFDFELTKGCYATTLLREFMKCEEMTRY